MNAIHGARQIRGHISMFRLLRMITILLGMSVFAQTVMIGHYLSGHDSSLIAHRIGAMVTAVLALLQFVAALLYLFRERGSRAPVIIAGFMIVVVLVQMIAGFQHMMFLHVPLGVALFGGIVGLIAWAVMARRTPTVRRAPEDRHARAAEPELPA
jgi:heme A synthase